MHAAVRSSVLSGATLLTAGAIAVTPVQPLAHMPSLPSISHAVSTAAVNLTSSPFDLYGQVLKTAAGNLQADVKSYLDMGLFPILRQILTNQVGTMTGLVNALGESGKAVATALTKEVPGYLGAAFSDLGKANVEGALNNLQLAIVLPIFAAINPIGPLPKALGNLISQPLQSVINIANDLPNIMLELGVGLIGPVASTLGAMGTATQNVINAMKAGDLGKLATAVIQAPATVIDGLLNGGYGPNLGALLGLNIPGFNIYGGGLFGGGATVPGGTTIAGTVQAIVAVVKSILNDITPAKPAAAAATTTTKAVSDIAAVPSTTATTVTLSTAAATKAGATDTASTDKVKATGSTSESTGPATEGTTKAGETKAGETTGTDGKATDSASAGGTKPGDSKTGDSKTGDTKTGDTKTGSSSSSSSSGSSSSSSSSSSGSDGTKTTTPGRKGHQGKAGSDSGSSAGAGTGSSSSSSGSASGSDSGAKGGSTKGGSDKGSHTGSKSKSKSHSAA
ncbi:hypothetical protein SBE55_22385 [Mycolicibacterium sp. 141076]|uniref:hypothetical protein n=2 Tax=Mycobacteriaceae TaxID=1762 RepID=UPI00299F2967|nr:hypothetical protein [Mycolicibacterium sp. 141076]MDX1880559.1 hypothetical protein [Mycolicibacterium sp. 141076]